MRRRLIFIAIALIMVTGCTAKRVTITYPKKALFQVSTSDGSYVGLIHLEPLGALKDSTPIVMCHGFTSTAATFDLGNGNGLGHYLAMNGYDVWLINLRGRGYLPKPKAGEYNWTFDSYLDFDLPAVIKAVRENTKSKKITWIGHSMGGLLIYAYLGKYGQENIEKIITIGSPVLFFPKDDMVNKFIALGDRFIHPQRKVTAEPFAKGFAGILSKSKGKYARWVVNPDNFSQETSLRYIVNSVPNLSGGVIHQIHGWAKSDRFTSLDGSIDYREGISKITVPALVIAGKLDHLAPTWSVYFAYEKLSSKDKTFALLGQANGAKEDPGHGGIVLGDRAKTEIYPMITEWLDVRLNHD